MARSSSREWDRDEGANVITPLPGGNFSVVQEVVGNGSDLLVHCSLTSVKKYLLDVEIIRWMYGMDYRLSLISRV